MKRNNPYQYPAEGMRCALEPSIKRGIFYTFFTKYSLNTIPATISTNPI